MKRQTLILLISGSFLVSLPLFSRLLFSLPLDLADFLNGVGVAFIISTLFVQKKLESKAHS